MLLFVPPETHMRELSWIFSHSSTYIYVPKTEALFVNLPTKSLQKSAHWRPKLRFPKVLFWSWVRWLLSRCNTRNDWTCADYDVEKISATHLKATTEWFWKGLMRRLVSFNCIFFNTTLQKGNILYGQGYKVCYRTAHETLILSLASISRQNHSQVEK